MFAQDTRVNGEVVNALARLVLQRFQDHRLIQVFKLSPNDH